MANNSANVGMFIPTTNVWDVSQIYQTDVNSDMFKELIVLLYQNINQISVVLNMKDSGYYNTQEFVNGQLYFPNPALSSASTTTPVFRQVYRRVINFGALPNAATKSVAHEIPFNSAFTVTRIYGAATDPVNLSYIPLPFAAITDNENIKLEVDATQVHITTGIDRTAYTFCYVVVEYLKN